MYSYLFKLVTSVSLSPNSEKSRPQYVTSASSVFLQLLCISLSRSYKSSKSKPSPIINLYKHLLKCISMISPTLNSASFFFMVGWVPHGWRCRRRCGFTYQVTLAVHVIVACCWNTPYVCKCIKGRWPFTQTVEWILQRGSKHWRNSFATLQGCSASSALVCEERPLNPTWNSLIGRLQVCTTRGEGASVHSA